MLLAALVLREHIPTALAASVAVAVTGVLLVVYQPGATGDSVGITLTLVSIGFCALYSVLTRRLLLDDSSLTRGARPAGGRAGVRGRPGHGRRAWPAAPAGTSAGSSAGRLAGRRGVRASCTTGRVLVLRHRPASGAGLVGGGVPAAHPGVRAGGRLPGRGAARAAAVGRRGRHRGRDRRDRAPSARRGRGQRLRRVCPGSTAGPEAQPRRADAAPTPARLGPSPSSWRMTRSSWSSCRNAAGRSPRSSVPLGQREVGGLVGRVSGQDLVPVLGLVQQLGVQATQV